VRPPKPPTELPVDGFFWWEVEAAGGLESKKLPPLRLEKAELVGWDTEGRGLVKLPKLEKASFCGDLTGGDVAKLRPLKASLSPPKALCCWFMPGEDMPLREAEGL